MLIPQGVLRRSSPITFRRIQGVTRTTIATPKDKILFAGLSHNHKHVAERNMANGMPGCACEKTATSLDKCCCKAKPILDYRCRYCMVKLKKADKDWYNEILGGLEREILSQDIDKEERAALTARPGTSFSN